MVTKKATREIGIDIQTSHFGEFNRKGRSYESAFSSSGKPSPAGLDHDVLQQPGMVESS
jgi:hypothetical protein